MKKFDYSLVKDPQYFCDGRMAAHSDHTYYRSEEEREDERTLEIPVCTELCRNDPGL